MFEIRIDQSGTRDLGWVVHVCISKLEWLVLGCRKKMREGDRKSSPTSWENFKGPCRKKEERNFEKDKLYQIIKKTEKKEKAAATCSFDQLC